jgi:hypothetical protein
MGITGPYLDPRMGEGELVNEDTDIRRQQRGPDRPEWLQDGAGRRAAGRLHDDDWGEAGNGVGAGTRQHKGSNGSDGGSSSSDSRDARRGKAKKKQKKVKERKSKSKTRKEKKAKRKKRER